MVILYLNRFYWYLCLVLKSPTQAMHLPTLMHASVQVGEMGSISAKKNANYDYKISLDLFREKSYKNRVL